MSTKAREAAEAWVDRGKGRAIRCVYTPYGLWSVQLLQHGEVVRESGDRDYHSAMLHAVGPNNMRENKRGSRKPKRTSRKKR